MVEGLVSTIIPVYNRPAQLREAVASVLEQDWRPVEIIIVDDGSTDDTAEAARELARMNPGMVRAVSQANAGPGPARQHGMSLARGEFIQYLDSDDVLLPGKFTAQVKALQGDLQADVAYGMTRYRHSDGSIVPGPWKGSGVARATMFPSFLLERWWDTPTPLYRRRVCERAGPWTDLRLEEDWEYDCRIAALGTRLAWCDLYVCEVRDHEGDRLCRAPARDAARLRERSRSHALILAHARRAGIAADSPEMQHFARALFLLARQCGAAGLSVESRTLFYLARGASTGGRAAGLDYRAYRVAAALVGWGGAGRASEWFDRLRNTP
ncbi:MAG: glycosyltransferase family 2 protein [Ramlibacter sp.]|nr:glycosyltransferase family A protein [Ramlibacter sp.]